MRILLLTTHLCIGGIPIYVVNLAVSLKKRGHKVYVASSGGELVKRLGMRGIPHINVDINTSSELNPKILGGIYHLYWFIKENAVEIVHTNTRVTQVMGEALSFLTGVCHVSTCHGFFKPRIGRRLFGGWGRRVIAISDAVREHLVNDFKIPKSRVTLIHNGIDLEAFEKVYNEEEKNKIKKELGLRKGPVVGIIARLSPVKGHKYLIRAMRPVVEKVRGAQLLIVGEGEEKEGLKAMAKEEGLNGAVIFADSVLDTSRVLSIIDVFVLPSIKEGLGLAILEALACERPVIGSDVGGIYSIIKDNVTGLLVPPRDPEGLAKAILRLLGDKALARELAENGRRFVRENFLLDAMTKKVEAVYKEV